MDTNEPTPELALAKDESELRNIELYGETAQEWLRRWDEDGHIWSIEMGGLGPGYEQAIQVLAVEIVRDSLGKPFPKAGEKIGDWGDATVARIDYKKPDGSYAMGGYSGAQVGAAKNLAWHVLNSGPAKAFEPVRDRLIQVSKRFPG